MEMEVTSNDEIKTVSKNEDENVERGNWTGKLDFILSCIGYAVGLGNVWRFPYLCYANGGGAFLIPYVIMLAIAGMPLFFLEVSFGQFSNLGPVAVWRCAPMFKGIGYGMVIISFLVCLYYNVIIAWAFYYLFASFQAKLPWEGCLRSWNDYKCRNLFKNVTGQQNVPGNNRVAMYSTPCTATIKTKCTQFETAAQQYFERVVLGYRTQGTGKLITMDDPVGEPLYPITLCLLLAWILVFICLIKGIKSSGRVVYFTAIFPYVVLIALVINGALLPGARKGIEFYMIPKWEKLYDSKVWADAATQIFYSLGISFGSLIAMSSYNKFKNNCYRDAVVVSVINCTTSIFAGFAIFSVVGFMSLKTGVPIDTVATSGPGLLFIVVPDGITAMAVPHLWSILLFLMIITLGLDSQFAMMEGIFSALEDEFKFFLKTRKRSILFKGVFCALMFLLALPMVTRGGIYWFKLVEWRSAGFSLFFIAIVEIIVICYVYGIKNFSRDIRMMLGFQPGVYWIGCWMVVAPCAMLFVFIFSCVKYSRISYGGYTLPIWAEVLGWLMILLCVIFIPIFAIVHGCKNGCDIKPSIEWGPAVEKFWHEDLRYKEKLESRRRYEEENKNIENSTNNAKRFWHHLRPHKITWTPVPEGNQNEAYVRSGDFTKF